MKSLIKKAEESHFLSKSEIIRLLEDNSINDELFGAADRVRKKFVGDEIHLRALIEFSNICSRNCFYCGVRAENKNIERYRLMPDEIIQLARNALSSGYKTIVLQSAEDMYYTAEMLADIIKEIKKNDTAVTLSIGERSYEEYKILKDAGADRFLLRIETTDKELYRKLHPNMSFKNRIRCLKDLKELGYETGTGCLVGLPDQTTNSLADDILFFKELDADMVGLGPLIPHKDTPLKDVKADGFWLSLKVLALTRLLLPDINIPATTAMETIHPDGRILALQSGANVVMPNVTDEFHRSQYEIYPGKKSVDYTKLEEKFKQINRTISQNKGFRPICPLSLNPSPAGRGNNKAKALRKNMTPQEKKLWSILRNKNFYGYKFKRQHPIWKYIVDFVCIEKRLIIELDGSGHNFARTKTYDKQRTQYFESRGFTVIRFWNNEIDNNIEGVAQQILLSLRERAGRGGNK